MNEHLQSAQTPEIRTWLRGDPGFSLALVVSCAAMVVPLWASALLPFMDLPQHLAVVRVLHDLGDPATGLARYHAVDFSNTQYLAYYFAVHGLAFLTSIETANRLVLSLYAIGLPLAVAAWLRAHRRDPALALLAAPVVYNTFLFMGFANYVTAIPLLFWGLALLQGILDRWDGRRFALLVVVTLGLFYSHAQAFVLYGILAGVNCLVGGAGWHPRHWWRQALHIAPAFVPLGIWMSRSLILAGEEEWKKGHGGRNVTDVQVNFEPLLDRLAAIPNQLLNAYPDDSDEKVLLGLVAIGALAALLGKPGEPDPSPRAWLRSRVPAILFAVAAVVYVASPISYKWIWPISWRLVPVVALLGLGLVSYRKLPWRGAVLLVPAVALSLWASQVHVTRARAFNEEAGPIREVLDQAQPGKRLMALIFSAGSGVVNHAPFLHFGQYYVLWRGGMANFSFANFPQSPVLYPTEGGPPTLPARWEWTPDRFDLQEHGLWYDYFLVRDESRSGGRPVFRGHEDAVELVVQKWPWRLYRRVAAFQGQPVVPATR